MTLHPNDKNQRSEKGNFLFCKFEESISSVILTKLAEVWGRTIIWQYTNEKLKVRNKALFHFLINF